jgi:hypothetical protein
VTSIDRFFQTIGRRRLEMHALVADGAGHHLHLACQICV